MGAERIGALIERLEKASGPDREIDALLVVAFDIRPAWLSGSDGEMYVDVTHAHPVVRWLDRRMTRGTGNPPAYNLLSDMPAYSGSLDAALALCDRVFPGRDIDLEIRETMTDGRVLRVTDATIYAQAYSDDRRDFKAYGNSPPLALCLALLRALSQKESSNA